jgi:hypothetical protein
MKIALEIISKRIQEIKNIIQVGYEEGIYNPTYNMVIEELENIQKEIIKSGIITKQKFWDTHPFPL